MSAVLTGGAERFGGFAVWTPHFVIAKADALTCLLDSKPVLFACSEVLAEKIPVFAVGKTPAGGACIHGRFPCVEATVLAAVFFVVVIAVAASRLVHEVFGKPVVVPDFDNLVCVTVARVLERLFRGCFFRRGGDGDTCHQKCYY